MVALQVWDWVIVVEVIIIYQTMAYVWILQVMEDKGDSSSLKGDSEEESTVAGMYCSGYSFMYRGGRCVCVCVRACNDVYAILQVYKYIKIKIEAKIGVAVIKSTKTSGSDGKLILGDINFDTSSSFLPYRYSLSACVGAH